MASYSTKREEDPPLSIRVNSIALGFIDTDLMRALASELFEERDPNMGIGGVSLPQDVASVVLFLSNACPRTIPVTSSISTER